METPTIEQVYSALYRANAKVFYFNGTRYGDDDCWEGREAGWYYWCCLPGCIAEGDPEGGCETEDEACRHCFESWDLEAEPEDDEDEDEDEDGKPDEDDYILDYKGNVVQYGKRLAHFAEDDDAIDFIREHMESEKFWPNVWQLSDHGNYHLLSLSFL